VCEKKESTIVIYERLKKEGGGALTHPLQSIGVLIPRKGKLQEKRVHLNRQKKPDRSL